MPKPVTQEKVAEYVQEKLAEVLGRRGWGKLTVQVKAGKVVTLAWEETRIFDLPKTR